MFGGRAEKYENAADLYTQAANAFRMQKQSMSGHLGFLPPHEDRTYESMGIRQRSWSSF